MRETRSTNVHRTVTLTAALGIAALSILPFLAALRFDLVWDDPLLLSQVAGVADRGGVTGLLASDFRLYHDRSMGFYRPVTAVSLWVQIREAWSAGGEAALSQAARALHEGNLLLHAACSLLVWLLLLRLVGGGWASWLPAAIFAVHPVHVEPAVFVAARTDSLAALGVLASLLCWFEGTGAADVRRRWTWFAAGGVLCALGSLAKEQALLLPAVLLVWTFVLRGRTGSAHRRVIWIAPWVAGAVLALSLRVAVAHVGFGAPEPLAHTGGPGWFFRLGIPALLLYLKLWFVPWPLNSYYTDAQLAPTWVSAVTLVATIALAAFACRRGRGREALAALAFTIIFLFPVLHLVPLHGAAAAERFFYLPSVGLAMLFALVLAVLKARPRVVGGVVALACIAAGAWFSVQGVRPWASNATLFAWAVHTTPNAPGGHYGLAGVLASQGRHEEAAREYEKAVRLAPDYVDAYIRLGLEYGKLGNADGARAAYEHALSLEPGRASIHTNLGVLEMRHGRIDEALVHFRRAVELDPTSPRVHYNLGLAQVRAGDVAGAKREIAFLQRSDPGRARHLEEVLDRSAP